MPFVSGFLRVRRRGGHPDQGLPPGEGGPVDPDYGIDIGGDGGDEYPDIGLPEPPPGIWPPLRPEDPWRPIDPGFGHGRPERPSTGPVVPGRPVDPGFGVGSEHPDQGLPSLPPGTIWPPLPAGVRGKFLVLVLIGGGGRGAHYRYAVIDAGLRPDQGLPGGRPPHPDQGLPPATGLPDQGLPPTAEPKG